jgi:hypothetical protein
MPQSLVAFGFLILATSLESTGDALVRIGLFDRVGVARILPIAIGAALLLGYGTFLNLAPLPFGRVVGLYIATLFVVWQIVSFFTFRSLPTPPVLIGGALIIVGGLIVSFWGSTSSAEP